MDSPLPSRMLTSITVFLTGYTLQQHFSSVASLEFNKAQTHGAASVRAGKNSSSVMFSGSWKQLNIPEASFTTNLIWN